MRVYVRIVEVEAYLDAKSDDTMMCERRKKDTLVSLPKALLWYAESHDGKKKEKTVGSYSPKKLLVLSPALEKDFVSRVIRFLGLVMRKVLCNTSRMVHKFFRGDFIKINAHILLSHL